MFGAMHATNSHQNMDAKGLEVTQLHMLNSTTFAIPTVPQTPSILYPTGKNTNDSKLYVPQWHRKLV